MARFDVYRQRRRAGFVVDCQSNLNSMMDTRVVIPLVPVSLLAHDVTIIGAVDALITGF